jgi:hypothetical protein
MRKILKNPDAPAIEHEKIILNLLNYKEEEAYKILGDYLLDTEVIIPQHYIMNYKGEVIDTIKTLIPEHLAGRDPKYAEKIILQSLTKHYSYTELRERIFSALIRLSLEEKGANQLLTILWSESPPSDEAKKMLLEVINYLGPSAQSNHLFWFLFTPEYLTQDFPINFNTDIYQKLVDIQGEHNALLILIQAMVADLDKPITNWSTCKGNYLKVFNEDALELLLSRKAYLENHPFKDSVLENLHGVLRSVTQADDKDFLRTFDSDASTEDMQFFIGQWTDHILSRFLLRSRVLELLNDLNDPSAQHIIEIVQQVTNYQSIENLKKMEESIIESPFASLETLKKVEILVEIIDWDFEEILEGINFTRLDYVSNLLIKIPDILNIEQDKISKTDRDSTTNYREKLEKLLTSSCKEAVRQYYYRKAIVQQIYKIVAFHETLDKREKKYQQLALEHELTPMKMKMHFNTLNDLLLGQKKRLLQMLFSIDQYLLSSFIDKLNDALTRIYSYPSYYIIYKTNLNPQDPRKQRKIKEDPHITNKLITFYRYFEGMVNQENEWKRYDVVAYRRIDAVVDLINDFITHKGHIDFEIEYFNVENP